MEDSGRLDELQRKFDENPRRYFAPLANEYRKAGRTEQAIELCRVHLPHQPGHMSGYIVYGQALFDAGRSREASAVFQEALRLDPENVVALRHLGDIARTSGERDEAIRWYEQFLAVDPSNEQVAAYLAELAEPQSEESLGAETWGTYREDETAYNAAPGDETPGEGPGQTLGEALGEMPEMFGNTGIPLQEVTDRAYSVGPDLIDSYEPTDTVAAAAQEWYGDDLGFQPTDGLSGAGVGDGGDVLGMTDVESSTPLNASMYDDDAFSSADEPISPLDGLVPAGDAAQDAGALEDVYSISSYELSTTDAEVVEAEARANELVQAGDDDLAAATTADSMATEDEESGIGTNEAVADAAFDYGTEGVAFVESGEDTPFASHPTGEYETVGDTPIEAASPFVTETMAELYLQQGFVSEALAVYRQLAEARNEAHLHDKVRELAAQVEGTAGGADVPTIDRFRMESATPVPAVTVRDFFAAIGARTPARPPGRERTPPAGLSLLFSSERVEQADAHAAISLASAYGHTGDAPSSR